MPVITITAAENDEQSLMLNMHSAFWVSCEPEPKIVTFTNMTVGIKDVKPPALYLPKMPTDLPVQTINLSLHDSSRACWIS